MAVLNLSAFKALLFADQNLEDLHIDEDSLARQTSPNDWIQLVNARSLLAQDRAEEAIGCLRAICNSNETGTRPKLWSWCNLRRYGVVPEARDEATVRGVVMEVRVMGGIDVLAVYEDNSVRYLNYTGKLIAWDLSDSEIDSLCKSILLLATRTLEFCAKNYTEVPQLSLLRVTLLTFNGNYRIEGEPNTLTPGNVSLGRLLKGGAMLMNSLINRAKFMNAVVPSGSR